MPSVHDSVVQAIRTYPSLYRCRTDVLHHFFCVNGNGMEWVSGELISSYEEPVRTLDDILHDERAAVAERMDFLRGFEIDADRNKQVEARARAKVLYENTVLRYRFENADDLAHVQWDAIPIGETLAHPKPIYPLCDYARMNAVPDDVKPDWLAAVREMIFVVFRAPARTPDHRMTAQMCETERLSNIAFASKVMGDLATRFGNPDYMPTSYEEWQKFQQECFEPVLKALRRG